MTKKYLDELTFNVLGAAIEVHKVLGPGLLEQIYHRCLFHELRSRNIFFRSELSVPISYKGLKLDADVRCDFFVENCLVVELKAVDTIAPIHHAQVMTYMKLLEAPKGLLVNFNTVNLFKEGQKTFVNEFFRVLPDRN